jgi:hypothetical protein
LLNPARRGDFDARSASEFNSFQPNSLRNRTGNFQMPIREFFSRNKEFNQQPGIASLRSDAVIAASSPLAIC